MEEQRGLETPRDMAIWEWNALRIMARQMGCPMPNNGAKQSMTVMYEYEVFLGHWRVLGLLLGEVTSEYRQKLARQEFMKY